MLHQRCVCLIYGVLFLEVYGDHRVLNVLTHSVPTRRSADLLSEVRLSRPAIQSGCEDETLADARAGWQSVDGERPDQLRSQRHEQKRQPDPDAQLRLRGAVLVGVSRGENVHDNCVLPRRRSFDQCWMWTYWE